MTVEELVEKLRQMRCDGKASGGDGLTAMTTLFGLIFHEEIGSQSSEIAAIYEKRRKGAGRADKWPGKGNNSAIRTGRRMAPFVDPHPKIRQKWREVSPNSGS